MKELLKRILLILSILAMLVCTFAPLIVEVRKEWVRTDLRINCGPVYKI